MFFSLAALLASAAAVSAADHQIIVGGTSGLVFTPPSITAAIGDTVTFEFQSKNHTVTQSSFASPCTLLQNATTQQVGFDSDFVPVDAAATSFPAWTLSITGSSPIWFYCRQTGHCQQGMVGAINAPTTGSNTFEAYQALAKSGTTNSSTTGTTTTGSTGTTGQTAGGTGTTAGSTDTPSPAGRNVVSRAAVGLGAVAAGLFLLA